MNNLGLFYSLGLRVGLSQCGNINFSPMKALCDGLCLTFYHRIYKLNRHQVPTPPPSLPN
jgi:hypothetical protein